MSDDTPRDGSRGPAGLRLAAAVRRACLAAAREAYEDAGLRGLCAEGRWEAALGAIAAVDLEGLAMTGADAGSPGDGDGGRTP